MEQSPQGMKMLAMAVIDTLPDSVVKQMELEEAVMMFQGSGSEVDYELITERYDPLRYRSRWHSSYGHLFDTDDDFDGQMNECFMKAVTQYEPGNRLNPFYWGILKTTFANIIKHRAAAKRNRQIRCPICHELVAPLSSHILKNHPDLIVDGLEQMNIDFDEMEECPLCSEKRPVVFRSEDDKIKHFRSRHSSIIFNRFIELYPEHHTAINDPAPPMTTVLPPDHGASDDARGIDDLDIHPVLRDQHRNAPHITAAMADTLRDNRLSHCQRTMIEVMLCEDEDAMPSFVKLCKMCKENRDCPRGEDFKLNRGKYNQELNDLQNIIRDHFPEHIPK